MGFMDSYKRLEKLCSELYGDHHGVTSYIDEMKSISNGAFYVRDWDDVLKQLKHYRWVRNQIVHNPGCTEENMCNDHDARWLDNFYSRIMSVNDPLALYRSAMRSKAAQKSKRVSSHAATSCTHPQDPLHEKKPMQNKNRLIYVLLGILLAAAAVILHTR